MNLHQIVSGAIGSVNPPVPLQVQISTGSTEGTDGTLQPTYAPVITVMGQVQSLQYTDLLQLGELQIQGTRRKIYLNGDVEGLVRSDSRGGDLITTPDGRVWKVAMVLEHWPDWTCCAVTLQDGA